MFGAGDAPGGLGLSSGGDPFAGVMPPPSGVKYEYTPIAGGGGGGLPSTMSGGGSRPPPPPPPNSDAPPTMEQGNSATLPSMDGVKGIRSGPQPVNPDKLVDSQFLPHTAAVASTTAALPVRGGGGERGGGFGASVGIANYETEPM